MNENNYSSLKLSKILTERGFKGETNLVYINDEIRHKRQDNLYNPIPAYDLIWDICIKYGKELFGEKMVSYAEDANEMYPRIIFNLLQQNKKQEAEDYIIKNLICK